MKTRNEATLEGIPAKMVANICTFLPKNDLLSMRLTSWYFSSVTVTELSEQMTEHMRDLAVIIIEEGLRILLGLCQISEFRQHIRGVQFLNHGFFRHKTDKVLNGQIRAHRRVLIIAADVQSKFEGCTKSPGYCSRGSKNALDTQFSSPESLEDMRHGTSISGARHSREGVGHCYAPVILDSISPHDLRQSCWAVFQALIDQSFPRRVIEVGIEHPYSPQCSSGEAKTCIASKIWKTPQLPCLFTQMPQLEHLYSDVISQTATIVSVPGMSFNRAELDVEAEGRENVVQYLELLISNFAAVKPPLYDHQNPAMEADIDFPFAPYVLHTHH
ncbi:hypothetical protein EJ02DRAFT_464848 [Clathrospora elynae]|uniref:F-box domain-containing protein n=1 Tax=Clathrospora elynae TaxID=706981 RepID=A0A6A5SUT6_9PLEO|nr:hypothetical protein EJ02DRAFT_464848 [Clathrospora elynae]